MNVQDVEGIGPAYAEKLASAGITTTEELLERCARPKGRAHLAETAAISPKLVLEWVNQADLMRLSGVGTQYADLLSAAGVDSPLELARRNPANLARTFVEIDAARPNLVRRVPSEETVAGWVEQAKTLARAVFHEDGSSAEPEAAAEPVAEPQPEPVVAEPVAEPAAAPVAEPVAAAEPEPEPEPVAEPVVPVVPPAARALASTSASAPERTGLWARIKRMIGMG